MAAKGDPLVGIVAQYQVQKTQKRCRFGPNVPLANAKTLLGVTEKARFTAPGPTHLRHTTMELRCSS